VLKKLQDLSIKSWCRDGKLYSGFAYWPDLQKKHRFRFRHNIIESDLKYQREEDISVKVKVESILADNTRKSVVVGDEDGEENKIPVYAVESETELKKIGEEALKRFKKPGYVGSFETFGKPSVQHGDILTIEDPEHPERDGQYIAKRVSKTFGFSGYRQVIELAGAYKK
jgi:hypothetical protein